ncbi:MAG: nucleotidyltransferase family protein [Candidatus Sabulitectum sp.]|nr:nucleotidyltransferase family protein [Candidatus Sabulitectum sp.]
MKEIPILRAGASTKGVNKRAVIPMAEHQTEMRIFLELADILNGIGSVPILYGSLALSQLMEDPIEVHDIDILVEDKLFSAKLSEIHELMRSEGFKLIDPEENEFERNGYIVGIASDGDFECFSGIEFSELEHCLHSGAGFKKTEPESIFECLSSQFT